MVGYVFENHFCFLFLRAIRNSYMESEQDALP